MLTLCHNYFGVTSNNKNNKDDDQTFSKRRFAFGLFILFLVSVLWVVSSELTKVLYLVVISFILFLNTYLNHFVFSVYIHRKKTWETIFSDICKEFVIVCVSCSTMFYSTNKRSLSPSRLHCKLKLLNRLRVRAYSYNTTQIVWM